MEEIGLLQIMCRNGRVMLIHSEELNRLLKDSKDKDMVMVLPIVVNKDSIQIREIDVDEFKNLLPNAILTSPYEVYFDNAKKPKYCLNTKPISIKKLYHDAQEMIQASRLYKSLLKLSD